MAMNKKKTNKENVDFSNEILSKQKGVFKIIFLKERITLIFEMQRKKRNNVMEVDEK